MPDYAVGMKFTGKDMVSATMKRMGKQADVTGKRMSSSFRNATKAGYDFQTIVKGIVAANLLRGGIGQIGRGLHEVIGEFINFDDVMIGATARFKDIGPYAANFGEEVKATGLEVRKLAGDSRYMVGEVARGVNELAKADFTRAEALAAVVPMTNIAKATQTDLNEAMNASIDIMGAFGVTQKSMDAGGITRTHVMDVLTKATLSARLELDDLRETMKFIGPIATEVGVGFEQATAMAVFLAKAGLRGTVSATQLKAAMLRLPTKAIKDELHANGIEVIDQAGNMRNYTDILRDSAKVMLKLGSGVRADVLNRIFGLRGVSGAPKLMRSVDALEDFEKALKGVDGLAKDMGDQIEKSLLSKFLRLGSAALETGFRILDAFKVKGKRGIDGLTEAVKNFKVQPVIDSVNLFVTSMQLLWAASTPIRAILPELIGGFIAWKIAMAGMGIIALIGQVGGLVEAFALLKIAMWALMAANPLAWIPLAISLAVAGFIFLERKFGVFSKSIMWIWDKMKAIGKFFGSIEIPGLSDMGANIASARSRHERALRVAPNEKDAAAAQVNFKGRLDIAGAPEGSTFKSSTNGAPDFAHSMLGGNFR